MNVAPGGSPLIAAARRFLTGAIDLDVLYLEAMTYLDDHDGPLPAAQRRLIDELRHGWHALEAGKLSRADRDALLSRLAAMVESVVEQAPPRA